MTEEKFGPFTLHPPVDPQDPRSGYTLTREDGWLPMVPLKDRDAALMLMPMFLMDSAMFRSVIRYVESAYLEHGTPLTVERILNIADAWYD